MAGNCRVNIIKGYYILHVNKSCHEIYPWKRHRKPKTRIMKSSKGYDKGMIGKSSRQPTRNILVCLQRSAKHARHRISWCSRGVLEARYGQVNELRSPVPPLQQATLHCSLVLLYEMRSCSIIIWTVKVILSYNDKHVFSFFVF